MNGFVLLEILKGKGQIGGQLQQYVHFRRIEHVLLTARERDDADCRAVDEQRNCGHRPKTKGGQYFVLCRRLRLADEVIMDGRRPGTDRAFRHARGLRGVEHDAVNGAQGR